MSHSSSSSRHGMAIVKSVLVIFLLLASVEIGLRTIEPALVKMYEKSHYALQRFLPEGRNHAENRMNVVESLIHHKTAASPRLVFVGDSILQAAAIVTVEETLPGQIEKYLRNNGWPEARTFNTAFPGVNSVDECRILLTLSKKLPTPTVFIVAFYPQMCQWKPQNPNGNPESWLARNEGRKITRDLFRAFHSPWTAWNPGSINLLVRLEIQERLALFRQLPTIRHRFQRIRARRDFSLNRRIDDQAGGRLVDDQGHPIFVHASVKYFLKSLKQIITGDEITGNLEKYTLPVFLYTRDIIEQDGNSILFLSCPFFNDVLADTPEQRQVLMNNLSEINETMREAGLTIIDAPKIDGEENFLDPVHHLPPGQAKWARHVAPDVAAWLETQGFPRSNPKP